MLVTFQQTIVSGQCKTTCTQNYLQAALPCKSKLTVKHRVLNEFSSSCLLHRSSWVSITAQSTAPDHGHCLTARWSCTQIHVVVVSWNYSNFQFKPVPKCKRLGIITLYYIKI